ncbi:MULTISPECIES: DUF5994 family protein [unclassified Mycobacterium]|uniref:DUF5994 family protein n=1 Tax=unclassified Mycobacterium TaxID=2642494 RepID=UPI0029C84AF4|nr:MULTISPECIES: DUF5994 family protein [unclassified Mycobacterium]
MATTRARRPTVGTLRYLLKPAHQACGFVQGAWWPRSPVLTAELPSLLTALSLRFGPIDRVRYHENDWSPAPHRIKHQGAEVVLDDNRDAPNVILVSGLRFGALTLLVVPPYTDATQAYTAVTTAADANDSSTPDELLGFQKALHRWESDGGAVQ